MVIVGFLRSMSYVYGPAVSHVPAMSQISRVFVDASATSVPSSTLVANVKFASAGLARPEPVSVAVHGTVTFESIHPLMVGALQLTVGGVVSTLVPLRL